TRPGHRAGADRAHDLAVLALNAIEVGAPLRRSADVYPDGLARDDEATEIIEKAHELRIAGGLSDAAMKGEVLIACCRASIDRRLDGLVGALECPQLRRRGAFAREPGRLDLDPGAQLHHFNDVAQGLQFAAIDAKRPPWGLRHECADALTRDHQAL